MDILISGALGVLLGIGLTLGVQDVMRRIGDRRFLRQIAAIKAAAARTREKGA